MFVFVLGKDVDDPASLRLYNTMLLRVRQHFFKKFLYFFLHVLKPTVDKRLAFNILQNRRVPDCAVSVVCQLIGNRIIGNAVVFDGYCFANCMRLASLEKIISLHKNHLSDCYLIADRCSHLFPLVPTLAYKSGNALKALINQGFLDFVKGLFPLFPLFLTLYTRN